MAIADNAFQTLGDLLARAKDLSVQLGNDSYSTAEPGPGRGTARSRHYPTRFVGIVANRRDDIGCRHGARRRW